MICTCGNPKCKVGKKARAREEYISAILVENKELHWALIELKEKIESILSEFED